VYDHPPPELVSQQSAADKEDAIEDEMRLRAAAGRWNILSTHNAIALVDEVESNEAPLLSLDLHSQNEHYILFSKESRNGGPSVPTISTPLKPEDDLITAFYLDR
jgi:hypothetical protein